MAPPPQPPAPGQAPGDESLPYLLIYPPTGGRRKRVRLPPGTYDIGRKNCDINLNYEGIADLHASLMAMPDGNVYVQDRGSGLPTLLNGHQFSLSPFQPGDNVQIGTVMFGLEPASGQTRAPSANAPTGETTDAGAGAWVQAALRGDRTAADAPTPPGDASPMPVRRIGKEDAERAQRVANSTDNSETDPHVSAKDWVRQALEDSERHKRGEIVAGEAAPSFTGNAGPRTAKRKKARRGQPVTPMTGPERAAAARFSKLQGTMSFLPTYKKRKRRRSLLVVGILIVIAGGAAGGTVWIRKLLKEARAGQAHFYVGVVDKLERDGTAQEALDPASGSFSGVQAAKSDNKRRGRSSSRSGGRNSSTGGRGASKGRAESSSSAPETAYDDGIVLSEAGTDEVIRAGERAGPVYGPGGSRYGGITEGERLRGSYVHVDDPDVIAIGNPTAGAPTIDFGSPNLDGMMYDESDGGGGKVRRMQELEFELAEDTGPSGRGYVDMRAVENVLHGLNPSTRMCYSRALKNSPGLQGTMVLILTLGTSGQMTSVSLDMTSSTLTNTDLKRCIERQIKSRNYPIPDGGSVTFSYPFRFSG